VDRHQQRTRAADAGRKVHRDEHARRLYADAVFSMDTAADGTLWVGSYGGVARIRGKRDTVR